MEFFDVVKNRYSCKKFDGRQVDAAQLKAILEAGTPGAYGEELAGTENLRGAIGAGIGQDRRGDALPLWRAHGADRRL